MRDDRRRASEAEPLTPAALRPATFEPVNHAVLRDVKACGGDGRPLIRLLSWIALACLATSGAAAAPLSLAERAAALRYAHLLDAAKANPATTDWTALRAAYAASPAYDPNVGHTPAATQSAAAMQRADFATVAKLADQVTAQNWMDLRGHVMAMLAYARLNDAPHAAQHRAAALGLFRAIVATGNGAAPATAFHVLATSEEYVLLLFMNANSQKQTLVHQNGHAYDILSITHAPDPAAHDMWFNVDTSLARETAVALGQAVPVPDAALPR